MVRRDPRPVTLADVDKFLDRLRRERDVYTEMRHRLQSRTHVPGELLRTVRSVENALMNAEMKVMQYKKAMVDQPPRR